MNRVQVLSSSVHVCIHLVFNSLTTEQTRLRAQQDDDLCLNPEQSWEKPAYCNHNRTNTTKKTAIDIIPLTRVALTTYVKNQINMIVLKPMSLKYSDITSIINHKIN